MRFPHTPTTQRLPEHGAVNARVDRVQMAPFPHRQRCAQGGSHHWPQDSLHGGWVRRCWRRASRRAATESHADSTPVAHIVLTREGYNASGVHVCSLPAGARYPCMGELYMRVSGEAALCLGLCYTKGAYVHQSTIRPCLHQ